MRNFTPFNKKGSEPTYIYMRTPFFILFSLVWFSCKQGSEYSDQSMLDDFEDNKDKIAQLVDIEMDTSVIGRTIDVYQNTYFELRYPQKQLDDLGIKKACIDFNGCHILLVMQQEVDSVWDLFIEEKGILYSLDKSCRVEPLSNNLDQFREIDMIQRATRSEAWRFRPINKEYYLYYRKYSSTVLN